METGALSVLRGVGAILMGRQVYTRYSRTKVSSFLIFSLFVGMRGDLKCFGIFFLSQIKISAFGFNLHRILLGQ